MADEQNTETRASLKAKFDTFVESLSDEEGAALGELLGTGDDDVDGFAVRRPNPFAGGVRPVITDWWANGVAPQ